MPDGHAPVNTDATPADTAALVALHRVALQLIVAPTWLRAARDLAPTDRRDMTHPTPTAAALRPEARHEAHARRQ